MRRLLIVFAYIFFSVTLSSSARAASPFGQYTGVLHLKNIPQDQLARLDFISDQNASGEIRLRAVLVLYFGDFNSSEYSSFDYDNVTYNLLNGTLVFDSAERELSFVVEHFGDGKLDANLKLGAGEIGTLNLTQSASVTPTRPLIQPISGEYRTICQGHGERLQVHALPFRPTATSRSDPFTQFSITAELGENGGNNCISEAATCITKMFQDADYNFAFGRIDFHSKQGGLSCSADETGLTCGDCRYQKRLPTSTLSDRKEYLTIAPSWNPIPPVSPSPAGESIQGTFYGYVHQEHRDVYHPMIATIATYRQPNPTGNGDAFFVSLTTNIGFGESPNSDESITVKFDPRPINILNPTPVFDRVDHNSDTIIKLARLDANIVEGTWYSRRYGRVGKFLLNRSGTVKPSDNTKLIPALSGSYSGDGWRLDMDIGLSDNSPMSSDPFYPLTIHGRLGIIDITTLDRITAGAYDPFTGMFMVSSERLGTLQGRHDLNGVFVKRPNTGILRPMQPYPDMNLRRTTP